MVQVFGAVAMVAAYVVISGRLTDFFSFFLLLPQARKGVIRIMVEGLGVGEIGPIPVSAGDTIAQVEAKVQAWIAENVEELDFTPPETGILGLAFEGRQLDSKTCLLDEQIPDMAKFQVPVVEEEEDAPAEEGAAEGEGEGEGESDAPAEEA